MARLRVTISTNPYQAPPPSITEPSRISRSRTAVTPRRVGWIFAVLGVAWVLGYVLPRFGFTSVPGLPFNWMEPILTITPAVILPLYWEAYCRISKRRFVKPVEVGLSIVRFALIYMPVVACILWVGGRPPIHKSYAWGIVCGCASLVLYDWVSHQFSTRLKRTPSLDNRITTGEPEGDSRRI